ncbi:uncharacterized protein F5891DRAFT_979664 [Suillus fuscotomentosus]|uniref:DUF6830 domain-containing protein n=1 Tax=Suillus fuscotomentosus TaxID=1912939 RepID=A0AAD4E9Z4_9AGAM|nr:uncharacterized protein F5891DRAFT_979664 [Suillus fuscotomentosus]KAG1901098.1 hypothetical protein F5891DRAFT_979664 [Suillus fuscotomentosus]
MFGESLEEEYDGTGASYSQDGSTFLDLFDADEYAECRVDNLYYPFTSKEEWEVADYLLRSFLSMAAIDEFLKLSMDCSFHSKMPKNYEAMLKYSLADQAGNARLSPSILPSLQSNSFGGTPWNAWKAFSVIHCFMTSLILSLAVFTKQQSGFCMYIWNGLRDILLGKCKHNFPELSFQFQSIYIPINECRPLMKAAEVGIMMSNLVGNIHHCFTLLAAYIVDTPEAAMLAYVHGKTSPFTMALYFQFGYNFQHPACTCSITLGQLTNITVNPDDLEAYFEACADSQLNGISLHLSDARIIAPLARKNFMTTIFSAQCPAPNDDILVCINQSLSSFHEHKDVILILGAWMGTKKPIENWHIPKLELLQSITSSMRKVGTLIQWSADATKHAHISEIKEPAWQTNNKDYDPQICRHLDWEEKLRCFAIATSLKSHPASRDPNFRAEDILEEDDLDNGDEQETNDPRMALLEEMNHTRVATNYFHKARKMATHDVRERGIVHGVGGPRQRPSIDCLPILPFNHVQLWDTVHLQHTSFHNPNIVLLAQTIHASPPGPGWPKGLSGSRIAWQDQYLCYVWHLNIGPCDPATGVHVLKCAKHADGTPIGSIIPLCQLCAFISIIPHLGDAADVQLTSATSTHYSQEFF